MSKVSLFLFVNIEGLILHLRKSVEAMFQEPSKSKKSRIVKGAVNECIKDYSKPEDEEDELFHFTICGECLNDYTPTLSIVEQSVWHKDEWVEDNNDEEMIIDFTEYPLYSPYDLVSLGRGIYARCYRIEDVLFDCGFLKKRF